MASRANILRLSLHSPSWFKIALIMLTKACVGEGVESQDQNLKIASLEKWILRLFEIVLAVFLFRAKSTSEGKKKKKALSSFFDIFS